MMVINPSRFEPDPIPLLDVELQAEIGRLTAGAEGESELERIYQECDGPVSRRKAILDVSGPRLAKIIAGQKRGCIELTVLCKPWRVDFELAWSVRRDWLRDAPVAVGEVSLPILRAERGADRTIPNGTAEGTW